MAGSERWALRRVNGGHRSTLARDYPMLALIYASHRSTLTKDIGLGRKPADVPAEPPVAQLPARRARGAKG